MSKQTNHNESDNNQPQPSHPGILKVMQSVLAGAIGVQSGKRREEDFSSQSPWPYIITGIVFTGIFVVSLILIVQWVLSGR